MKIRFIDYFTALRASDLSGPQRAVALWIAGRCSNGWNVKLDDVVSDSGFSRATVARAISELETKKWLIRCQDKKRGNRYEILIPEGIETSHCDTSSSLTVRLRESPEKSQSETTEVSQRDFQKSQSETTYTRTKQEQKINTYVPSTTSAFAQGTKNGTLKQSDLSMDKCVVIAQKVSRNHSWLAQVDERFTKGQFNVSTFATSLYCDPKVFERHKPLILKVLAGGQ